MKRIVFVFCKRLYPFNFKNIKDFHRKLFPVFYVSLALLVAPIHQVFTLSGFLFTQMVHFIRLWQACTMYLAFAQSNRFYAEGQIEVKSGFVHG